MREDKRRRHSAVSLTMCAGNFKHAEKAQFQVQGVKPGFADDEERRGNGEVKEGGGGIYLNHLVGFSNCPAQLCYISFEGCVPHPDCLPVMAVLLLLVT